MGVPPLVGNWGDGGRRWPVGSRRSWQMGARWRYTRHVVPGLPRRRGRGRDRAGGTPALPWGACGFQLLRMTVTLCGRATPGETSLAPTGTERPGVSFTFGSVYSPRGRLRRVEAEGEVHHAGQEGD